MERFWSEIESWSNDMKGTLLVIFMFAVVAVVALVLLTAKHANDNMTMRYCLEHHTPQQCKVMELSGYEFTKLGDE